MTHEAPAARAATTKTGIAYELRGDGELTLAFLPGWCGPRTVFEPLTARLAGPLRTLALDWRGHGDSAPASGEFGLTELVDDAVAALEASGAARVVPVSIAHAGWVALELRRRLGPARVPAIVLLDWMVLGAPPPFLGALAAMADPAATRGVVDEVSRRWLAGLELPALSRYVASMVAFPDAMWARAARAITGAFTEHPSPLAAFAALPEPTPTLHLYAQPADPAFLDAQRRFAEAHPWFACARLEAASHFPMFEVPDAICERVRAFVAGR